MASYLAVLKAKPAEFSAWSKIGIVAGKQVRALFEVAPNNGVDKDLSDVVKRSEAAWPGGVFICDTGYLDQLALVAGTGMRAIEWLANAISEMPYQPTVRPGDGSEVHADVAAAHALHAQGACLRLGSDEAYPDRAVAVAYLPVMLAETGLNVGAIDLVVDMWAIPDGRTVTAIAPIALDLLDWAAAQGEWRSVTVLSGAFPAQISNLATNTYTPVQRYDADLWLAVVSAGPPVLPDFGDFAVQHPALGEAAPYAPLPNLRYTYGNEWWIWREAKAGYAGNEAFFNLCSRVVASPAWAGAGYSWGDSEIERCSTSTGGAGTATQWRAYGTSHHIAAIVDHLTTTGAP